MSQVIWTVLSSFGRLAIIAVIMAAFGVGFAGTIYLSLRSPEVEVPDIVSKDRFDGEATLRDAGLNVRVRAARFKAGVKSGMILDQSPRPGEVVKVGQTVAVVLSREPKDGEAPAAEDEGIGDVAKAEGDKVVAPGSSVSKNDNQNRAPRNRNANRNTANKNANTNTANANVNRNVNANRNANVAVRNANTASGNTNQNTNNRNAVRNASNVNRRPPAAATPAPKPAATNPAAPKP